MGETLGVGLGSVIADEVDEVERRKAIDIPMVDDDAEDICAPCEAGMENATCELGATCCTLTVRADVTDDGSAAFVLGIGGGSDGLEVIARADRVGLDFGLSDWAAGTG